MSQHILDVTTSGRYHTLGTINPEIETVWIVLHGYGMRADTFIKWFDCIADKHTLIVAPEGLHRFYTRGGQGEIGASWMTSDLRQKDIDHNYAFLDGIFVELIKEGLSKEVKLGVLGFSQGADTASRWATSLAREVSQIVIWGAGLAPEVYNEIQRIQKLNASHMKFVVGTDDRYLSNEDTDTLIIEMHNKGIDFDFHTYQGGHTLDKETIRYFHARLMGSQLEN